METQSFLFVVCVNDEALFARCRRHIDELEIPDGFTLQVLSVKNARSMAGGYNQAIGHPARYKIYMHQDTMILDRRLLYRLSDLFGADPALGLIGVAGCAALPPHGIWWDADRLSGQVLERRGGADRLLRFAHGCDTDEGVEDAEAIDGLFMATQYDLRWRDDLFHGFHFYDSSQSLEFIRAGYKVGVARQAEPICLHDCGDAFDIGAYEADRAVFVREYMAVKGGAR
ncbi:glycosyltransferase family protein [Cohnella sp. GCM10020058]|uniref:glycosyltransferase family protein n=1 Tax=Cohnella sp. GCM10020058 TaxID=3317330 RepID=UPI0036322078